MPTESIFKDYEYDPDFYERFSILMEEGSLTEPSNHGEVLALYLTLHNTMLRHLGIYGAQFKGCQIDFKPWPVIVYTRFPVPVNFSLFRIHEYTK